MTIQNLNHVQEIRDHWWSRPGWKPGRLMYTWHLTFEGQDDFHRTADRLKDALIPVGGLNPVPNEWLHLTLQGVGYTDEVSSSYLSDIVAAVREHVAELPPLHLLFRRAVVLEESVVVEPEPSEPVHDIFHSIRRAIATVSGDSSIHEGPENQKGFRAHVSVAYSNTDSSAEPYVQALQRTPIEPVVVDLNHVTLIRQERLVAPQYLYRWETEANARLRGA